MSKQGVKKKILLVADRPNWAYYHIAKFIKESLASHYDFYIDFVAFNTRKEFKRKYKSKWSQYKAFLKCSIDRIVYQSIRSDHTYDIVLYLGYYFDVAAHFNVKSSKIIKGIYTQKFPPQGMEYDYLNNVLLNNLTIDQFNILYFSNADALVCGASCIQDFYQKHVENVYCANGALDEKSFRPSSSKVKKTNSLILGWTGNPSREFKGFYTHIIPAVKKAQELRENIVFKTRFKGPLKTLPAFYNDIDLIVIASNADAGPSLFGEASLCGIPSISTKVGWPLDVIEDGNNGYLVEREINAIVDKIIYLYDHPDVLSNMSEKIRIDFIDILGVEVQKKNWINLFENVLSALGNDQKRQMVGGGTVAPKDVKHSPMLPEYRSK